MEKIYKVSEINQDIKNLLEKNFEQIAIIGELSFRDRAISSLGHFYFSIKDEAAQLRCVMWAPAVNKLSFKPVNGEKVILKGRLSLYTKGGDLQLVALSMEKAGLGELMEKFRQLKKKLIAEGLITEDGKKIGARQIPVLPQRIGVVTSPTGAAIKDILSVINRRFANVQILIYPVQVQGSEAPREIAFGISELNRLYPELDVLLVGRGGGSIEDLWAFNEEIVARSILNSKIPVISCVGHEIDWTIADFVSDLRAPTPSAAAEIVVKNKADLIVQIENHKIRLKRIIIHNYEILNSKLLNLKNNPMLRKPEAFLEQIQQRIDRDTEEFNDNMEYLLNESGNNLKLLREKIYLLSPVEREEIILNNLVGNIEEKINNILAGLANKIENNGSKLQALSPNAVLRRGYSITRDERTDKIIRDSSFLSINSKIRVRFSKGEVLGNVEKIN